MYKLKCEVHLSAHKNSGAVVLLIKNKDKFVIFFEKTSKEMNWLFKLKPVSIAILQNIFY